MHLWTLDFFVREQDYFAMEILDGHLHVHLDLGTGAVKIRASRMPLDDGAWHKVTVPTSRC